MLENIEQCEIMSLLNNFDFRKMENVEQCFTMPNNVEQCSSNLWGNLSIVSFLPKPLGTNGNWGSYLPGGGLIILFAWEEMFLAWK